MAAIPELMSRLGWTQEKLALYVARTVPCAQVETGPPWWLSWPMHLRQAVSHRGLVYEIQAVPGSGGTSLALTAMMAQKQIQDHTYQKQHWLMGIEPPGQCFNGHALAMLGFDNDTLIMGRPENKDTPMMALQAVRSGLFAAVFIDLSAESRLGSWVTHSRRLMLAARESHTMVWLQTSMKSPRQKPLSSQVRMRVTPQANNIDVQLLKHARGGAPWYGGLRHPATWHFESEQNMFLSAHEMS